MKSIVSAMIAVLIFSNCKEQSKNGREARTDTEKNIYRSGDSMMAAFKRRDWITFVRYNHPNMTRRMGGETAFASFIAVQMKQIPTGSVKDIALGKILQVVHTGKDEQCVVEQNLVMNVNDKTLNKKTYLIGESLDRGRNWTFFDVSAKAGIAPKDIKPDVSAELKIPATKNEIN